MTENDGGTDEHLYGTISKKISYICSENSLSQFVRAGEKA